MRRALCLCLVLCLSFGVSAPPQVTCSETPVCQEARRYYAATPNQSLRYYGSPDQPELGSRFDSADTAFIMVHGTLRNADQYFCWALQSMKVAQRTLSNTFVMAPKFTAAEDKPEAGELFWDENTQWKEGNVSTATIRPRISSFTVMDNIISILANNTIYPKLKRIILAGHSAGGQYTGRYAIAGQGILGLNTSVELLFAPANPSTWTYLESVRASNLPVNGSCVPGSYCNNMTIPTFIPNFQVPNASVVSHCSDYNNYIYGLEQPNQYIINRTIGMALHQFGMRMAGTSQEYGRVVVLLGEADVCNEAICLSCDSHDIDRDCEANMQGLCRYMRGWFYHRHVKQVYDTEDIPEPVGVPGVGHDACGIFTSPQAAKAVFGPAPSLPPSLPSTSSASSYLDSLPLSSSSYSLSTPDYNYSCVGNCKTDKQTSPSAGFILMGGGTDVDDAFKRQIEMSDGGDFVIIRVYGTDAYNAYIQDLAKDTSVGINSVSTFVLNNRNASFDSFVLNKLNDAEAVFIAGGNQAHYIQQWANTPLQTVLRNVTSTKGAPIGGTSAGCAVLGQFIYTAFNDTVYSSEALENPYNFRVTLGHQFVALRLLQHVITDPHFVTRDRMGRLVTFVSRLKEDGWDSNARGIGVDEHTAIVVSNQTGIGEIYGIGTAYFVDSLDGPEVCKEDTPLTYRPIRTQKMDATYWDRFDFERWQVLQSDMTYELDVDDGKIKQDNPYSPPDSQETRIKTKMKYL